VKLSERLGALLGDPVDLPHLEEALTHPSFSNELRMGKGLTRALGAATANYQRLEFLGDAVLQLLVSERLYAEHPDASEGQLSFRRASIVSTEALASFAGSIELGPHLKMGKGADASNERAQASVLADAVEAILGAVYLDRGIDAARAVAQEIVRAAETASTRDKKSELQERIQALAGEPPRYEVVSITGPDHAREFEVTVTALGRSLGRGRGRSKKLAEHAAAREALEALDAATGDAAPCEASEPEGVA
jgi:ribonuclease III